MRRSSFARAIHERPARLLHPVPAGQWRIGTRIDEPAQAVAKDAPMRSEQYRRWVASQPCLGCGYVGASQCAHANVGKGMGTKVCDSMTFPLCGPHGLHQGCHTLHDLCVDMSRETRRELEDRYVRETQAQAEQAGWDIKTLRRQV